MAMRDLRSEQTSIEYIALDRLFPMHVVLNASGQIEHIGPTLDKIVADDLLGRDFFDVFSVVKPRSVADMKNLSRALNRKIVLSAKLETHQQVEFRCSATRIGRDQEQFLIDFSFSADFIELIWTLELSSADFKPNDFSLDLIYTVETQRTLVEDSQKLTQALARSKQQAEKAANIDVLTGIANRRSLYECLWKKLSDDALMQASVLLHFDLDKFKAINDNFGHAAGDAVLQQTASALKDVCGVQHFPARIGGDEFAVIATGLTSDADIQTLAEAIAAQITKPIEFEGNVFQVGVSVGLVKLSQRAGETPDQLFSCSDIALYEAKKSERSIVFLTHDMLERHQTRATLIKEIVLGLNQDEFEPFFQPKVNTRTREITGIEVLARWQHPHRGLLPPAVFIEVANSAKLMGAIEQAIMKKAIRAYKGWIDDGLQVGVLSFNLSAANLHSLSFTSSLQYELDRAGLSPENIALELLESVILERSDRVLLERCRALRDAGFNLALDDFGTGHASISTLIDNPISTIKIDRSFVSGIHEEERLQRITRSILALSRQLDLEVVAEGVETQKELDILSAFGCYVAQGYLFSRPIDRNAFSRWIRTWEGLVNPDSCAERLRA